MASASPSGRWLFNDIAALTLAPGSYRIGSVFFDSLPPANIGPFTTIPEVSAAGAFRSGTESGLVFPTSSFGAYIIGANLRTADATVPEPATLALFAIGAAGFGFRRRAA